jgi:hypothetical protein
VDLQVNVYNLANRYYYDQLHPNHIVLGAGRSALIDLKEMILEALGQNALFISAASAPCFSAALQLLCRRPVIRDARGQRNPLGDRYLSPDSHRSLGDVVLYPSE